MKDINFTEKLKEFCKENNLDFISNWFNGELVIWAFTKERDTEVQLRINESPDEENIGNFEEHFKEEKLADDYLHEGYDRERDDKGEILKEVKMVEDEEEVEEEVEEEETDE